MSSPFFSVVQDCQHLAQAVALGGVVGGVLTVIGHAVVRGTTRQLHKLEDFTLRPEPLLDVRVVGAGSALQVVLVFFHACIIPHPQQNASLGSDLFSIISGCNYWTYTMQEQSRKISRERDS